MLAPHVVCVTSALTIRSLFLVPRCKALQAHFFSHHTVYHNVMQAFSSNAASLAHGFRLDRLAIVRTEPATFSGAPSAVDDGTRKMTDVRRATPSPLRMCHPQSSVTPKPARELHIPIRQRWHSAPRPHPSSTSLREGPPSLSGRSVERARSAATVRLESTIAPSGSVAEPNRVPGDGRTASS